MRPIWKLAAVALGLGGLLACQEPFGTDRHLLAGDRIAGLSVMDGQAVPLVVVDGRLWADELPELRWHRSDDPSALSLSDPAWAEGSAPALDEGVDDLSLVAGFPSGDVRRAVLTVEGAEAAPPVEGILVLSTGQDLGAVEDLSVEARSSWTLEPVDWVEEGGIARLDAGVEHTRWMATAGTFLELQPSTADWAAGTLVLDDGEVVEGEALEPGWVTVIALEVRPGLLPSWRVQDLWVGPPPAGAWTTSGRWLAGLHGQTGFVRGTLVADDQAPSGLALEEVSSAEAGPPWGTEDLCAGVEGPFDPTWLAEARCARADVVGAEVILQVAP